MTYFWAVYYLLIKSAGRLHIW